MRKSLLLISSISFLGMAVFMAACGSSGTNTTTAGTGTATGTGKTIATGPAGNNLTATISNAEGSLKKGQQEFTLTFSDASGKPVDVGNVAFTNHMAAMGSMAPMNDSATLTTTGTSGVYKGKIDVEMAGEWQAQITYEGAAGKGAFSLPVVAR